MPSNAEILVLSGPEVEPLLRPADVLAAVREAFLLHSEGKGRVFPVVRERLDTGGVFGIKSGDVQAQSLLGFKASGFWPANRPHGSEPHQATVLLFDPATGRPTCLIDGNAITTARTGAAGALGLQQLARPDSTRLCLFRHRRAGAHPAKAGPRPHADTSRGELPHGARDAEPHF